MAGEHGQLRESDQNNNEDASSYGMIMLSEEDALFHTNSHLNEGTARAIEMHILRCRYPRHEATNHEAPGNLATRHEIYTSATNEYLSYKGGVIEE